MIFDAHAGRPRPGSPVNPSGRGHPTVTPRARCRGPDTGTTVWGAGRATRSLQILLVLVLGAVAVWALVQVKLLVIPVLIALILAAAASPLSGLASSASASRRSSRRG